MFKIMKQNIWKRKKTDIQSENINIQLKINHGKLKFY